MKHFLRSCNRLLSARSPTSNPLLTIRLYSQAAAARDAGDVPLEAFDQRKLPADYDPATFDPAQHGAPPTDRVWRLVDELSSLTLAEVAELTSILASKRGIKDPPVVAVMRPGAGGFGGGLAGAGADAGGAGKEEKPEKTVFEIKLEAFDAAAKIKVIKEVRAFTDLGLKEAKELVEKAPVVIKGGVSKEEGEKIVEKMKAVGAKVVLE